MNHLIVSHGPPPPSPEVPPCTNTLALVSYDGSTLINVRQVCRLAVCVVIPTADVAYTRTGAYHIYIMTEG